MIRLRHLALEMFGQFTDKRFDFGPRPGDGPDFHIVHGPNEAGKTTTMEGFLRLLYGFPLRDPYAFRHERKMLRVSGSLDLGDRTLALTRLPSRDGNLVDAQGQALPEQALTAHLGGLGLDDYRNLLCLDDETIERGGEEIASAKGDIGRLLFSAAAGIADLTGVLDDVRARADGLYRKRGSKTRMAELKRDLAEVNRRIRDEDTGASAYRALHQAIARRTEEEDAARQARAENERARAAVAARRAALPKLAEIERLDALIAAHPGLPERLGTDPETLVQMLTDERQAEADRARLDTEIAGLEAARAEIRRDPKGLALAPALDALEDLRSRYDNAEKDLPRRQQALADTESAMRRAARDLDAPADIDPAALAVSPATLDRLEQARDAAREARRAAAAEAREIADLDTRIAEAEDALARLAPAAGPDLGAVLQRFAADTLAPRHAAARQAMIEARRQADAARDALALPGLTFEALPVCPLTRTEAAALAASQAGHEADLRQAEADARDLDARIAENAAELGALEQADGLVGDAAAAALRDRRDALWTAHRAALTDATALPFEDAMRAVDAAAATRLGRARDLGQLRQLEQDAARLHRQKDAAAKRIAAATQARDDVAAQLADAATEAGIAPFRTADALPAWLDRLEQAQDAARRHDRLRAEHAPTFAEADRLAAELVAHLDLESRDFDTLLDAARRRATEDRDARAATAQAKALCDGLGRDRDRRKARHATLTEAAAQADGDWRAAVAETFGDGVAADVLEASFAPLRDLREAEAGRATIVRRIATMAADQDAFVAGLAEIAASDADAPPLEAFKALRAREEAARAAEAAHDRTIADIEARKVQRKDARRRLAEIADATRAIARDFPAEVATDTLADLRRATDLARQVIDARRTRAELADTLCTALDAADLGGVRAILAGTSATDLDAELRQRDADADRIEAEYRDAIAARGTAERDLRAITGDADIASLTERKATLELEMREVALSHLTLHFGHDLAEEAIRRYRDAHRGAMMQATETAFAELTNDAYTRLRTLPDGSTETLVALDPEGRSKRAQDMSKGTRFQLYLALRAAAYEQLAQQGTVLPFFCDDIFETFDEDRTRAACRLMARIGRTGQAIYLTHHAHVVEIAREVCGEGLKVHTLEPRG